MALILGEAAERAYQRQEDIDAWAVNRGFDAPESFDHNGVQGFVTRRPEAVLIVFRGTDERSDWKVNLDSIRERKPFLPGQVHKGFCEALAAPFEHNILPAVQQRGSRRVWITGHSLGGALAALCAARLIFEQSIAVTGLYTYGQPRVGDDDFADAFRSQMVGQYHRYTNDKDIVPHVPLLVMKFRHTGAHLLFDALGELHDVTGHELLFVLRSALEGSLFGGQSPLEVLRRPDLVSDHGMKNYVALLTKKALAAAAATA